MNNKPEINHALAKLNMFVNMRQYRGQWKNWEKQSFVAKCVPFKKSILKNYHINWELHLIIQAFEAPKTQSYKWVLKFILHYIYFCLCVYVFVFVFAYLLSYWNSSAVTILTMKTKRYLLVSYMHLAIFAHMTYIT